MLREPTERIERAVAIVELAAGADQSVVVHGILRHDLNVGAASVIGERGKPDFQLLSGRQC
jgi:hypothetical protein